MLDNLSPLSNSTSALLESWIWSEQAWLFWSQNWADGKTQVYQKLTSPHGYFMKFPHTCCLSLSVIRDNESSMKWKAVKLILATCFHSCLWFCSQEGGGRHPPGRQPPDRHPLLRHPPRQTPPWADTSQADTHPGPTPQADTPLGRHPQADTPLPSACWDTHPLRPVHPEIHTTSAPSGHCSERYAS